MPITLISKILDRVQLRIRSSISQNKNPKQETLQILTIPKINKRENIKEMVQTQTLTYKNEQNTIKEG